MYSRRFTIIVWPPPNLILATWMPSEPQILFCEKLSRWLSDVADSLGGIYRHFLQTNKANQINGSQSSCHCNSSSSLLYYVPSKPCYPTPLPNSPPRQPPLPLPSQPVPSPQHHPSRHVNSSWVGIGNVTDQSNR